MRVFQVLSGKVEMAEESKSDQFAFADEETEKLWLGYTTSRFEDASRRIDDHRSWGRQLVIWIAVLIGLEANLFPKVSERLAKLVSSNSWYCVVLSLCAVVAIQFVALSVAAYGGYVATKTLAPERPTKLLPYLRDAESRKARATIAAYFAKSYNHQDDLAEKVSTILSGTTAAVVATVWLCGLVLAGLFWFTRPQVFP